eukprot:4628276-Pleurochrysis_carterae.AAC.1
MSDGGGGRVHVAVQKRVVLEHRAHEFNVCRHADRLPLLQGAAQARTCRTPVYIAHNHFGEHWVVVDGDDVMFSDASVGTRESASGRRAHARTRVRLAARVRDAQVPQGAGARKEAGARALRVDARLNRVACAQKHLAIL